jgi:hypothetical protein
MGEKMVSRCGILPKLLQEGIIIPASVVADIQR